MGESKSPALPLGDGAPVRISICLLYTSLVLTEEDAVAYGQYLTPLPTAELNDLTYTRYTQDCADRRASACTAFEMTSAGFHAEATLDRANLMFFSVPYDDGFTAYVDAVSYTHLCWMLRQKSRRSRSRSGPVRIRQRLRR